MSRCLTVGRAEHTQAHSGEYYQGVGWWFRRVEIAVINADELFSGRRRTLNPLRAFTCTPPHGLHLTNGIIVFPAFIYLFIYFTTESRETEMLNSDDEL